VKVGDWVKVCVGAAVAVAVGVNVGVPVGAGLALGDRVRVGSAAGVTEEQADKRAKRARKMRIEKRMRY
jgi:hypothetical protein